MLEFYNDRVHKARKEHRCEFCNQQISIGEQYHRQSGKYDGDFFDRKLHMSCEGMISEYCHEYQEWEDISYDGVIEWLVDKHCYSCHKEEDCSISIFDCEKILKCYRRFDKDV